MQKSNNINQQSKQSKIPTKLKYAVLICDSFNPNTIFNIESYNCLSQFDQYPIVWYTLNWLSQNNIQEMFVIYSKDKDQIQKFFDSYSKSIDLKYHMNYVKPGELKSFGDAVRQVQFRNLVNQDFLMLYADTITNIDLSKVIQSHFTKKQQLKSVVLTTTFQPGHSNNIHLLNSNTNQILQIQSTLQSSLSINTEKINLKKVSIEFRRDIVPCQIFIGTVQVLKSFKQSYQYSNMNEFIIGMLTSQVYEQKINAYVIAQHEHSYRTTKSAELYKAYMNYICGYLSPYTIHTVQQLQPRQKQLKQALPSYSIREFNKVIKHNARISSTAKLSNNCYIGENTVVGDNCQILRSIVLRKTKISANIVLENCLVLDGCEIISTNINQKKKYQYCKFQKMGNSMKITSFKDDLVQKFQQTVIDKELYEETPNDSEEEKQNFQEQLESLVKQEPNSDSVIDLFTLRKCHNKQLNEFTKEIVRVIEPNGVNGVKVFVQKWGSIVLKLHQEEDLLLNSLAHTCQNIDKYKKALHIFLQFFYIEELVTKQAIKKWFSLSGTKIKPETLALCKPFLEKLDQESEEQEDQEDEE